MQNELKLYLTGDSDPVSWTDWWKIALLKQKEAKVVAAKIKHRSRA